jgi:hypothetical protein
MPRCRLGELSRDANEHAPVIAGRQPACLRHHETSADKRESCLLRQRAFEEVFTLLLNEIPSRNDLCRMRSGVRFMMRAISSSDFAAFTSSITRRSSANDHDLRFKRLALSSGYYSGSAATLHR